MKNLSVAVLQLNEAGELTHLRDKWWASSCIGAHGAHASGALKPHDLRGLFLLLGLGLGVGLLLALLELLARARTRARAGKVRKESLTEAGGLLPLLTSSSVFRNPAARS